MSLNIIIIYVAGTNTHMSYQDNNNKMGPTLFCAISVTNGHMEPGGASAICTCHSHAVAIRAFC